MIRWWMLYGGKRFGGSDSLNTVAWRWWCVCDLDKSGGEVVLCVSGCGSSI